jgi:hypothetical protein
MNSLRLARKKLLEKSAQLEFVVGRHLLKFICQRDAPLIGRAKLKFVGQSDAISGFETAYKTL